LLKSTTLKSLFLHGLSKQALNIWLAIGSYSNPPIVVLR